MRVYMGWGYRGSYIVQPKRACPPGDTGVHLLFAQCAGDVRKLVYVHHRCLVPARTLARPRRMSRGVLACSRAFAEEATVKSDLAGNPGDDRLPRTRRQTVYIYTSFFCQSWVYLQQQAFFKVSVPPPAKN